MRDFLRLALVAVALGLTACGGTQKPDVGSISNPLPGPSVSPVPTPSATPKLTRYKGDEIFRKYLDAFLADAFLQGVSYETSTLTIQFSDIPGWGTSVVGLCETGLADGPRLSVKPSFWDRVDETQRTLLMYHELGHCLGYRGHLGTLREDGNPVSIMYPIILSDAQYAKNKASYLRELFTLQPADEDWQDTYACTPGDL